MIEPTLRKLWNLLVFGVCDGLPLFECRVDTPASTAAFGSPSPPEQFSHSTLMKTKHITPPPAAAAVLLCVGLLLSAMMVARAWQSFTDRDGDKLPMISAR